MTRPESCLPFILATLLFCACGIASGATFYVSDAAGNDTTGTGAVNSQYKTIRKALAAAQFGDVVIVEAGVYSGVGNVGVSFEGITLITHQGRQPRAASEAPS